MVDRDTGVALFDGHFPDFGDGCGVRDRGDVGAVGHEVRDEDVVELKDVVDHLPLFVVDGAGVAGGLDLREDLGLGDGVLRLHALEAEELHDEARHAGADGHGRPLQRVDGEGDAREPGDDAVGALLPDLAGDDAGERHQDAGREERDDDEREDGAPDGGDAEAVQPVHERRGEGQRGRHGEQRRHEDAGERDGEEHVVFAGDELLYVLLRVFAQFLGTGVRQRVERRTHQVYDLLNDEDGD